MRYRKILYSNYFTNQAGRNFTEDNTQKFKKEKKQFNREILPLLSSDKSIKILDIGCGIGSLISVLKDNNFNQIKGIDISEEQVQVAHSLGVKEVDCQDIHPFLISDTNTYDVICGIDIIEHFTKDELVDLLQLLKSKLKNQGQLIFRTPNADAPLSSVFAYGDFTHENLINANSARQLMLALGFKQIKILPSNISIDQPILEWIRILCWQIISFKLKCILFASGRSTKEMVFTPNMIITGKL